MSTKSPALQLAEPQLAKLTSESEEIRMRALDQVETRFIRCLQLGETIDFKPLLLMKQLIRWFGHTPHLAADRVLAIMLELLRSEYGGVVVRKITYERLSTELGKVRRILRPLESKRVTDLLDDLQYLLLQKYNIRLETPSGSSVSSVNVTTGATESVTSSISILKATLRPEDYEPAWTQPCPEDLASLQSMMDMPRNGATDAIEVQVQLTHLTIRMGDYPAEYLLQPPHIFLILVQLQQRRDGCLLHVNRAIMVYLKQLQRRIEDRCNIMCYATSIDAPGSRPRQVRVESALALLLTSCLDLVMKCSTSDKWHLLQLVKEAIKTYEVLRVGVSPCVTTRLGGIVKKLLNFCSSQTGTKLNELVSSLMVPRLQSLIFNDQLMEITLLNIRHDKNLNRAEVNSLIQPILMDSCFLNLPGRMSSLGDVRGLVLENSTDDENLFKLKIAYMKALDQLQPTTGTKATLLNDAKEVCLVVNQLGSKKLLRQLFDAVVECTPLYRDNTKLRTQANELLCNLVELPDKQLRWFLYGLMRKPVTNHFHAFMNKTTYKAGCNNQELVRLNILGLPLSTELLRKVILQSWDMTAPDNVRQWCLDYFILLFKLNAFLGKKDLKNVFHMLVPLLPLLICRSITDTPLDNVIWSLWNPSTCMLDPPLMMRIYTCYLFHPHSEVREKAPLPINCILQSMDKVTKTLNNRDELIYKWGDPDICIVDPPVNYKDIFAEPTREAFQGQRSLDALIRLLDTKDLRPPIRKSSMTQLNVLLRNWKACECYNSEEGLSMIVYSLPNGLDYYGGDPADILVPAVSILLKLMLQNPAYRVKVAYTPDMYMNLLRTMLLLPHERELRQNASICLFLMLFHDSITATEDKLVMDIPLGGLIPPVTYEEHLPEPSSAVIEGINLQEGLDKTYFGADPRSSAQHWRLFLSQYICKIMNFESMQVVDIRNELKMNLGDLALMQASESDIQLRSQLLAAGNCSSHDALQQKLDIIQLFIVYLRSSIPESEGKSLWKVIHKYIRSAPANDADCRLYMSLLELCLSCLRFAQRQVIKGLSEALEADPNHSFFLLLQDRTISLDVLHLIGQCLEHLLATENCGTQMKWHTKLFLQLSAVARKHFEIRQLQHVRCILGILRRLSEQELILTGIQVMHFCQHFMQLSSDLRTSTHTGAQWQRDCLHIICEIHLRQISGKTNAMCEPEATNKVLRYLLGLCGHSDSEVRALSWVLMADWIICCDVKIEDILPGLNFLPGGLPACCLTTLLDVHEVMLVRVLAGSVFILLMPLVGAEGSVDLLRNHTFLKDASRALRTLHVSPHLDKQPVGEQHSCEIISCYVSICVTMVGLDPEWCSATLCQHSFMSGLSDVMKTPPPTPEPSSAAFFELCAEHICELYALCYVNNFEFLQRSICRDSVFLENFLSLMTYVMDLESPERLLSQLFKLLLVFCKDSNAFSFLCEELKTRPSFFLDFFMIGLHQSAQGTELKRYTLKCLALIFIKKQGAPLVQELENYVVPLTPSCDQAKHAEHSTKNHKESAETNIKAIEFIYRILEQLFIRYYATRTFNFLQALDPDHIQVCETFGVFLKYSNLAATAADEVRLLDRIIIILDTFLNDEKIGNAASYVRRVGAHRSQEILGNLLVLFKMLSQWFSSHHSVIKESTSAATMVNILVRLWPWLSHSAELKQLIVQAVMFFTEHSFEMCKHTSLVLSGQSHTLLQLMSRVADFETTRKEPNGGTFGDGTCLIPALRIMSNCCSCSEGRQSLSKMHVLDIFDTILPANPSCNKVRPQVVQAWLAFWEVYSRYDVGARACHLHSLIGVIRRLSPLDDRRLLSLRILRNMCFFNINRTVLTDMTEFTNMLRDIVNQPVLQKDPGSADGTGLISFEEHRLAVLMLYRLFGFGAKYKAMLRGTKLMRALKHLEDQLTGMKAENPDRFPDISYATELSDLLTKLFAAVQA
ncbi:hypothetical protein KR032_003401 [Drosophila birchii]|nr:hypothetical protein KR032_003401 [Drosophila birchii]